MSNRPRFPRLVALLAIIGAITASCAGEGPSLDDAGASREVAVTAPAADEPPVDDGITLRLGVGDGWERDPAVAGPTAAADRVVAALVHEGLTRIDRRGDAVPALAERWFVSDDRLQWTFVLPAGLTDGRGLALSASDVKASMERLAERGPADHAVRLLSPVRGWDAFVAGETGGAAGLTAADESTLVISLEAPFEPLPEVLAEPALGVFGVTADGSIRTTGAYTYGASPSELLAVDPTAAVGRIELVSDQAGGRLLARGLVDWAVLGADEDPASVPGDVLRQPLGLATGIVARLADPAQRQAVLGALNPAELGLELPDATVAVAPPVEARPDSLPATLTVHLPAGPLTAMADELTAQLVAAGVDVTIVELEPAAFARAVVDGEAMVFPMVHADAGYIGSVGIEAARAGGADDVFGTADDDREVLIEEIEAERDRAQRVVLADVLEGMLTAEHLWLPIATAEVAIGLSERMTPLRILPDGTLDLSGFGS